MASRCPTEFHITKGHLSSILHGFQRSAGDDEGYDLYSVKGWDYPSLCETYLFAAEIVRREHVPAIVHVTELTQPQGHSTSGSHERYKSAARLDWEREYDCLHQDARVDDRAGYRRRDRSSIESRRRIEVSLPSSSAGPGRPFRRPIEAERRRVSSLIAEAAAGSSHEEGGGSHRCKVGQQTESLAP